MSLLNVDRHVAPYSAGMCRLVKEMRSQYKKDVSGKIIQQIKTLPVENDASTDIYGYQKNKPRYKINQI